MRLRSSLILLVIATVVPLVALAVILSALLVSQQNENFLAAVKDRNRAFMSAVDSELKGTIDKLYALAASRNLAKNDFAAFYQDAVAVHATQPYWLTVSLRTAEGRPIMNAGVAWGTPILAQPLQAESIRTVVETGKPVIGTVGLGPTDKLPGIPVRVPVLRGDKVAYVLTAVLKTEPFEALMQEQRVPAGWVSGLIDTKGQYVARVPPRPAGTLAGEVFRQKVSESREAWYRGFTQEGADTYSVHLTSDLSNWVIGLAVPADQFLGGSFDEAWRTPAAITHASS